MQTVLTVCGDLDIAALLAEVGSPAKRNIVSVSDGAQALSYLGSSRPDLIVSDTRLADMDGLALLQRVRVLTGGVVPFVFFSSDPSQERCVEALRAGADDYILRTVSPDELAARLDALVARIERTRADAANECEADKARTIQRIASQFSQPLDDLLEQLGRIASGSLYDVPDLQRRCALRALEDARSLKRLATDMTWATAEYGDSALNSEMVRIAPIVRRSAASASRRAVDRNVQLSVSCGGLLSGNVDERAMVRTLGSLLEAVVDLSPAGSQVSLQARRVRDMGLEFVISEGRREPSNGDLPESLNNALEMARSVVRGHNGKFSVRRNEDGRQSYVLWVPGRAPATQPATR